MRSGNRFLNRSAAKFFPPTDSKPNGVTYAFDTKGNEVVSGLSRGNRQSETTGIRKVQSVVLIPLGSVSLEVAPKEG